MPVFGTPMIRAAELAETLCTKTCQNLKHESTSREWTRVVLDQLRQLGKDNGCKVSPGTDRAFLLDLIWWAKADRYDIALAVESEWGNNKEVWHDFGKLLVIKAPLKLMIYGTGHHEKESADVREQIEQDMTNFTHHVAEEEYLLIEFAVPDRSVYAYHFRVPTDGQIRGVRFEEIFSLPITW